MTTPNERIKVWVIYLKNGKQLIDRDYKQVMVKHGVVAVGPCIQDWKVYINLNEISRIMYEEREFE